MSVELDSEQLNAIKKLQNGFILQANVGVGKSRTGIAYYYLKVCQGRIKVNGEGSFAPMKTPRDLYIITTAKKRDDGDWEDELAPFLLHSGRNEEFGIDIYVDSWNNIAKYKKVFGAFFLFDEQRLTGSGPWVKAFYDIARKNQWILMSATPGDKWTDYIPVFVANRFYRNKTDFNRQHCVFARFSKYPVITDYMNEQVLRRHKRDITVVMKQKKLAERHYIDIHCDYDRALYRRVRRDRWDPWEDEPIAEISKLCYLLRRVTNDDPSRIRNFERLCESHERVVVFYNHVYELEALRKSCRRIGRAYGEWNGQVHSKIPDAARWAYLVQYTAGCEGWNCIQTDTMIFYSQSYSYRQTIQAEGRIDRRNTPYKDLYYYQFRSPAPIDIAIARALREKQDFNEKNFIGR